MNNISLKNKLIEIDDGRFYHLINTFNIGDNCLNCYRFNQKLSEEPNNSYRCAGSPQCIGVTLSSELISYLLWKLEIKSEKEHRMWIGI